MTFRKTKIICTLGPAVDSDDMIRKLMLNGMNVARINMSHGTHEEQLVRIERVKRIREELGLPVALLLDTKGPEIRTGTFKEGKTCLNEGDDVVIGVIWSMTILYFNIPLGPSSSFIAFLSRSI